MRLAMVGYGYWGPNMAKTMVELLGAERVTICETNSTRQAAATAALPGVRFANRLDDVLKDKAIEAVALCTPAIAHAKQVEQCLRAGKHVLVEKPLAMSSRVAAQLAALARTQRRVLMGGHVFLFDPAVQRLRELVQQGKLGQMRYAYVQRTGLGPRAREDVNVLWDYLIHDIVIFREICQAGPLEARATTGTYLRPPIADLVFAEFKFPNGFLLHCQTSWYDPFKVRRTVIVGSKQMALYDVANSDPLILYPRGFRPHPGRDRHGNDGIELFEGEGKPVMLSKTPPLVLECREFLSACRQRRQPRWSSAEDAIAVLEIVEALETSLRKGGRWIRITHHAGKRRLATAPHALAESVG